MMNSKFPNTRILKLEEIAAWWLPKQMKFDVKKDSINALLPSLQRGFVWKSSQIEFLWDSIAQGFPIGSLSLAEYTEGSPAKGFGSDGEIKNPTHYLLDGQQRATAIAMGFRDIWAEESIDGERKATETLWLDLVLLDKNERCFSFRVVTKAHPWGYQRTKPDKRISSEKARNALKAFRILNTASNTKSKEYIKPHELSLKHIFPWDAEAPIPVPLLIKAIKEGNGELNKVSKCLLALLEKVDFWNSREKYDEDAKRKFEKVKSILETPNDSGFERIVTGINEALKNTEVPAPILRHIKFSPDIKTQSNEDSDDHHVVFNLFKRINTGGTALSREDINYSMLKSIWPGAPEIIEEKLLKEGMIAQPPRLVSLMSRLVLMINNDDLNKGLQPELSISQFESHLREEFKDELQTYCETKGEDLLKSVWSLLTDNENSLPKTLAAQISQHSDDLMLLLMYWVHLLKENNQYECLSENTKKRTLGFFTAIAWFANDPKKSAAHLSKKLIEKNAL